MKNVLEFKNYNGSVDFSAEDQVFFGRIVNIREVVTFEAPTAEELTKAFHDAVNDYLATPIEIGSQPNIERISK